MALRKKGVGDEKVETRGEKAETRGEKAEPNVETKIEYPCPPIAHLAFSLQLVEHKPLRDCTEM